MTSIASLISVACSRRRVASSAKALISPLRMSCICKSSSFTPFKVASNLGSGVLVIHEGREGNYHQVPKEISWKFFSAIIREDSGLNQACSLLLRHLKGFPHYARLALKSQKVFLLINEAYKQPIAKNIMLLITKDLKKNNFLT